MTLKDATANSLLMFVAATCVVLIVKAVSPVLHAPPTGAGPDSGGATANAAQDGVHVYYIHGNFRCVTCRNIEEYAKEAVETGFGEELRSGSVEWRVINYESPGNERYAVDYEVVAPTVVLARFEGGRQVEWKGLHEVWEHVGNKDAFLSFVQSRLREFVGASQSPVAAPAVPVLGAPAQAISSLQVPIPEEPARDLAGTEAATDDLPVPSADLESPRPESPPRSPAESPQFLLPTPAQ